LARARARRNEGEETMNWTPRRQRFRAVLAGTSCVHPASVFDPVSARIAESLGFEIGMLAGSTASLTVLGAPDLIVLTLGEFAGQAYRICRAATLPLLVDADHGYGNALNVRRTVEELENSGVAALTIEDTVLPRQFGDGQVELVSIAEGVGKMRAALSGRQDSSLAIVGRTSALTLTGTADALARAKAYEAAGIDALFFTGVRSRAQVDALAEAVAIPLILGGVEGEASDLAYLSARRVRICLQGHQPIMAAMRAVHETLSALRNGTQPAALTNLPSAEVVKVATRDDDYKAWTKDFLGG
jgi:carboxyvinyl-carboxyphosphonate phosphorylmutase